MEAKPPVQIVDAADTLQIAPDATPTHTVQCRWVPGTLNQVRLTWNDRDPHEVVVAIEGLRDVTGRDVTDALYLRGHAEFHGAARLLEDLTRR